MSEEKKPRRFNAYLKEEPVELEFKDDKGGITVKTWTLRELMGEERNKFMESTASNRKPGQNGTPELRSYANFGADLLAVTLYDELGKLVPLKDLNRLPSQTQLELFKMSLKLSALDPESQEAAKNALQGNTQPGSDSA